MRIEDALRRFEVQLQADGRSHHTIAQYRRHIALFCHWLRHVAHVRDEVEKLDHQLVAGFLASKEANTRPDGGQKLATSTNCLRSSLRGFLAYCHRAGFIPNDPGQLIRRAVCSPPPPRALSENDQRRLLDTLSKAKGPEAERDHMLFHLLLSAGLRIGSAMALKVEDVDLNKSEICLRTAKGNRPDVALLGRGIRMHLARYLKTRGLGPLFPGYNGTAMSTRHAQRRLAMWAKRAGIQSKVSPHLLRHCFGMRVYRETGDILLAQQALGHQSIASTMIYARCDRERLRKALT